MTTLVEPELGSEPQAQNGRKNEAESWGLLLVPVLLCVAMLIFALMTTAGPASEGSAASRPCAASPETGPVADC